MKKHGTWPHDYRFRFYFGDHVVNATPAIPDLLRDIDGRELVKRLADAGVEAVYTYASNSVTWLYRTEVEPGFMHPALNGRDFFGEVADECDKRGIPFVGAYGYPCRLGPREWRHYYPTTSPKNARGVCWNTGYGDVFRRQMEEISSRYPMAGIFIDMLDHPRLVCCEGCARRFKERVGVAPPRVEDLDSPLYKAFKLWAYEDEARFVRELRGILQAHQPDATFVQNFHVLKCEDLYETADANDYIYTDPGSAFGYKTPGGAVALGALMGIFRNLSRGKPPFEILLDPITHGMLNITPLEPYEATAAMIQAQGGAVGPSCVMDQRGRPNDASIGLTAGAAAFAQARQPWQAEGECVRFAGLYLSQESALFYGDGRRRGGKYMDSFCGAYLMLQQEHWPTDVLTRRDIERFPEYPVIYLPNAPCLSDAELEAFRRYVEGGGTLVASYRSSLSNEWHDARDDFGLADVFGARFMGKKLEPHRHAALQMPLPDGSFATLPWENRNLSLPQAALVCQAVDPGEVLVPLHDRYRREEVPGLYGPHAYTRPESVGPAVIEHTLGKGRCVYLAGKVFAAYLFTGIASLRRLATRWIVLPSVMEQLAVRLKAPDSVEMTAWAQPERERILVHLVNFQSVPGRLTIPAPEIPETEQILPVHDLELELDFSPDAVERVVLQPDGVDLRPEPNADRLRYHIPKIHIHHIVDIRFKKGRCPRYPDSNQVFPYPRLDLRKRVQAWVDSHPEGYDPNDNGAVSFDDWIDPEAFMVDWHVIGPFPDQADAAPRPDVPIDLDTTYPGCDGNSVGWVEMRGLAANKYGFVEMCSKIGNTPGMVGYAATVLECDADRDAVFRVGNDDPCRLWINGTLCWEDAGSDTRDLRPDRAEFRAKLRKGNNTFLVRKGNTGHGMGFYLREVPHP